MTWVTFQFILHHPIICSDVSCMCSGTSQLLVVSLTSFIYAGLVTVLLCSHLIINAIFYKYFTIFSSERFSMTHQKIFLLQKVQLSTRTFRSQTKAKKPSLYHLNPQIPLFLYFFLYYLFVNYFFATQPLPTQHQPPDVIKK